MYLAQQGTKLICNYLNDNDVPTRHGDIWNPATIQNMITNPVYMGKIRRGWSKQLKSIENGTVKRRIKRSNEYGSYPVFDGLHPALISEEDFLKAQEIRAERKPASKVRDDFELSNPFAGLLFCTTCGKTVGRRTAFYRLSVYWYFMYRLQLFAKGYISLLGLFQGAVLLGQCN